MTRLYIYILTFSLLLAACSSEDTKSAADSGVAISFSTTMPSATTRAANAIDNKKNLKDAGGFGVFACYTGLHRYSDSNVRPDFMYNEHVTSTDDGSTWTYSPLKYWPNGEGETSSGSVTGENPHYVSFMAYAPYSDTHTGASGYCIPSFSLQGEIGNPWLTYRLHENVEDQVDLLYAKHSNEHPILDQTKPLATDSKVLFDFKHALACVGDKITIICSDGIKNQVDNRVVGGVTQARVVIKSFKIEYTLTSKARLVLWNQGEPNWQAIFSEAPICERTVTIVPNETDTKLVVYTNGTTGDPYTVTDKGVFYIPKDLQGYPQTAKITVTYCISTSNGISWTDDSDNTGSATISMKEEYPDAYQPGKHLYFNITLNQMSIGLTAAIAPWEVADPVEIEGIEE